MTDIPPGTIAWIRIVNSPGVCALVFSIVSAIILFALALPPTFHDFAWLGYVDFVSIIAAILITIISTGIEASNAPGGLSAVDWTLWPPPHTTLYGAFLSTTNIIFAYSFAICLPDRVRARSVVCCAAHTCLLHAFFNITN